MKLPRDVEGVTAKFASGQRFAGDAELEKKFIVCLRL